MPDRGALDRLVQDDLSMVSEVQDAEGRRVLIVGLGPGDPGLLTQSARDALANLDVLFAVRREDDGPDMEKLLVPYGQARRSAARLELPGREHGRHGVAGCTR
jgi:hypothetical protein